MMSVEASKADWLAPGCRLDRYDLLLRVAEGGMATLWLARQEGKHGFERIVAIKTILPKLASDAGFQRMFLDEARVVSRIEHPNVAHVLDLGEERGVLFLVMEWIDGDSLGNLSWAAERATRTPLPIGILGRVMVDACAGLHAAHELADEDGLPLGVVHRDVSPDNLLVGFRGTTKIIDFGIAKARNRVAQETSIGILKGKLAYMAPEQAMGSGVDRRTDVWSAGASMYRFLAGHPPYGTKEPLAMDPLAVLRRIIEGPPPAPLPKSIPKPIRAVVERAIAVEPAQRFASALAMGAALDAAMRTAGVQTTREDVAAFMTKHLGDARATLTREIEHTVRESRARMRVGMAHTKIVSVTALLLAQNDPIDESPAPFGENAEESRRVQGESDRPTTRPSRHPTAFIAVSPSLDEEGVPATLPPEAAEHSGAKIETHGEVAPIVAPVAIPIHGPRRATRTLLQWIGATCLVGVAVAGGFALRAAQPSHPVSAADVAPSPPPLGERGESAMSAPSASPIQAIANAPDPPPTTTPSSARPNDPHASPIPRVAASPPDRVSTHDLLERGRHARRAGRLSEAAVLFTAAVENAPNDSEALTLLADVEEAQGATDKGVAHYRRAVATNSRYLPARLGLADSLWTSGQRDEARTLYRAIVDQFPATMRPDLARERADGDR